MKQIPEWFIGGPLHGEDRLKRFPGAQRFSYTAVEPEPAMTAVSPNHIISSPRWVYYRQRFTIGNRVIVMWCDLNRMSKEVVASLLADILLAPHEIENPDKCICTDSAHSASGFCPSKDSGNYDKCPRRTQSEEEILTITATIRAQENTGEEEGDPQ